MDERPVATAATAEERERVRRLPAPAGLCASCRHLVVLSSPRSVFVRCGLADSDPRFTRYPGLPVVACPGWIPAPPTNF